LTGGAGTPLQVHPLETASAPAHFNSSNPFRQSMKASILILLIIVANLFNIIMKKCLEENNKKF
jgi:hypothetical protein